jgi:hypothetical protein
MKIRITILASLFAVACFASDYRSPLIVTGVTLEVGTPMQIDASLYAALKTARGDIHLTDFALDSWRKVNLIVHPFSVLGPASHIVLGSPSGDIPLPQPDVLLLRGQIEGEDGSEVYLGLAPGSCNGWVTRNGETYLIGGGRTTGEPDAVISIIDGPMHINNWSCETRIPPVQSEQLSYDVEAAAGTGPRAANIALETDTEFTGIFRGNLTKSATYVAQLFGAMDTIYNRDVQTRIIVGYLRLWKGTDPWDAGNTGDELGQFQSYWNTNMGGVHRAAAHFLSGRGLGGGVAWVGVICNGAYGYCVSANLAGVFNTKLDVDGRNWDPYVVAHEMGHQFGTLHTHDGYVPPIDTCGIDCVVPPEGGTIMSYCHICSGGMWNIHLNFHPRCIDRINQYLDHEAACKLTRSKLLGNLTLEYYAGPPGFSSTFIFRDPGTTTVAWYDFPTLGADGHYATTLFATGEYDLHVDADHWLNRLFANLFLAAPAMDLDFSMYNGDADYSKFVEHKDLNIVFLDFGETVREGDLDWNGTVDVRDLTIIFLNWARIGDD